ncbi:MAG: GntR family transcriptional regulator, partial [Planctomycetota bacterium]|nr:GntR family transcriptional regulator [Planctomycetota bacterium]
MLISRTSLREQVRDELLRRIGSGVLAPGDRVVEAAVADELGVSSVPVREAIRELVAMGILESGHHKGGWVREVSIPETIQALQVRAALESLAARLAAPAIPARLATMRRAVQDIVDAAKARDFVAFQQANQTFHREIIEASGNRILRKQWESLAFDVRTRAIMDYLAAVDPVEIAREHEGIVDAFERDGAERAATLLA